MVLQAHGLCRFQRTIKETLREKACKHQLEDDTEIETKSNSENLCNPVDDKGLEDIRQIVNPRLDSFHTDKEVEKKSATLLVPGSVRRYKYTVIAELRNNPELFTDRLRRVWGAGTLMESEKAGDSGSRDSNDSVGLFATVCLTTLPALANSYWTEYKGCTKKEPKDLSSMFVPLTLVTNHQMSKLLYLNTVALLKTAILITTRKLLWQCH